MTTPSDTVAANPTRELAAIMFSDIVGYTAIMGRDEQMAMRALAAHRELLRGILPHFNGRLIGEIGDGTLSSFHSAVDAVNCAREIQSSLASDLELRIRIGIHVGDVVFVNNTVLGDGVNVASRIHELAPPGGCCISDRVYEEIRNKPEFRVMDLGEKKLKNVARPIRAYALTVADAPGPSELGLAAGSGKSIGKRRRLVVSVGALLIAAVIVAVSTWKWLGLFNAWWPRVPGSPDIRTIAVLPLENLSGDPAQEYFADGMTDELITDLAKISGLRVISRTSVMKFKGEHRKELPEIARALNVNTIVEGSVLRVGDKVRITAQLIDARSDKHLWAESYERDTRDVLSMQDELAKAIAQQIDVELTPSEQTRFANPRPVNPDALDAYLKGTYFLGKQTAEGFQKAKEYFEQAIKIAPDYAQGYVGLGAYYVASDLVIPNQVAMPRAKQLLETALRLDKTNADVYVWLATLHWRYDYDWNAAEEDYLRAIELSPGNALAHGGYGLLLVWQARFDEAGREIRIAQRLDPLTTFYYVTMGQLLNAEGYYAKALDQCSKAVEINPNAWTAYSYCFSFSYDGMGNHAEALKAFEKGVAIEPGPLSIALLGYGYGRAGEKEKARKVIEQLNHLPAQTYVAPCYLAYVYLGLGENDTALDLEEKAYQQRSGCVQDLKAGYVWDGLHSDPRYTSLLKKLGFDK